MAAYVRPQSGSPVARAEIVRRAAEAGVKLVFQEPLTTYLIPQMLPFRGVAWVSGVLGVLALLMAAVGLYGVMAFGVNQRVREIGIRMALGATAQVVINHFVRQGLRLVGFVPGTKPVPISKSPSGGEPSSESRGCPCPHLFLTAVALVPRRTCGP